MKKQLLLFLLFPLLGLGQEYVDIFKVGYGQTFKNEFKDKEASTDIKFLNMGVTVPIPLNENHAFITGAEFTYSNLQLFPEAEYSSLYSTFLTLGLASNWNKKWSSTLVLLPKLASDFDPVSSKDFFMGGLGVIKFRKNENLLYRFGAYASQEAFGVFATPILGLNYLSENNKFEIDLNLPIKGDINYKFEFATVGIDYLGISRSFNLHYEDMPSMYVDLGSTQVASYLQFKVFKEEILLRTKFGYSSDNYEVYAQDDKVDLALSAFNFGDNRTQLNPSLSGSLFVKLELVYRYNFHK
ncbi:hypothetical protein EI546_09845 [Aequorivita sp. H23M31]|uniref:DUF6268 domain-containing protein n=1 Tax=Aequorivita ciconiae TaxID=2494375 RepID=A0A410G466_9FLAO|nr:DUF6268 family outer membrane beta-barrel protein [Aequorivita sp. H23M31]QAA82005.1 hypothetical protein EI546_09845 [Aequorivita sp. H23M31]